MTRAQINVTVRYLSEAWLIRSQCESVFMMPVANEFMRSTVFEKCSVVKYKNAVDNLDVCGDYRCPR
jgi:hypothetical protein